MAIFPTRYKALKARRTNPYFNGLERCVKVECGYALMDERSYQIWKKQK